MKLIRRFLAMAITTSLLIASYGVASFSADSYVAYIGDQGYTSLTDAINAASSGATIQLRSDVTGSFDIKNKDITIDLNGNNITFQERTAANPDGYVDEYERIIADLRSALVIFNGSLTVNDSVGNGVITGDRSGIYGMNGGSVVVNGGTITSNEAGIHSISGDVTINGGTVNAKWGIFVFDGHRLTVNGGTIIATGSSSHALNVCGNGSSLTVTGGDIIGGTNVVCFNEVDPGVASVINIDISGGTFRCVGVNNAAGNVIYDTFVNNGSKITGGISGGTFINEHGGAIFDTERIPLASGKKVSEERSGNVITWTLYNAYGHSLSLGGDIGVNFFFNIPGMTSLDQVSASFRYRETTYPATPLSPAGNSNVPDTYNCWFSFNVPAKDCDEDIEISVYYNGELFNRHTYTVKSYIDYIEEHAGENQEYSNVLGLVRSLEAYGDYAQAYFSGESYDALPQLDPVEASAVAAVQFSKGSLNTGLAALNMQYYGSSLVLDSLTELDFYFTVSDGFDIAAVRPVVSASRENVNVDCDVIEYNGYAVVRIPNIQAQNIGSTYTIHIGENTFSYSPLNYIRNALNSDNARLASIVTALYRYYENAYAYHTVN